MIPRRNPDTRPQAVAAQILRRRRADQYGAEKGRSDCTRPRPIVTRNGIPVRPYVYRGTGESMTETEAEWWLTGT